MWKQIMLAACGEPLFNWRLVLPLAAGMMEEPIFSRP